MIYFFVRSLKVKEFVLGGKGGTPKQHQIDLQVQKPVLLHPDLIQINWVCVTGYKNGKNFYQKKFYVLCFEDHGVLSEGPVACPGVLKKKLKQDVSHQWCDHFYQLLYSSTRHIERWKEEKETLN